MFDSIKKNLRLVIDAVKSPDVATISAGLVAAGELLKDGHKLFADLFGKMFSGECDPIADCEAVFAVQSSAEPEAVGALPWRSILSLIKLLFTKVSPAA